MNAKELKEYIIENDLVETILSSINMHNIVSKDDYYQCSWENGDNPKGCIIYKDSLHVMANTKTITNNKKIDPDIFTLVEFCENINFPQAIKFICNVIGIDMYEDLSYELPLGLQFLHDLDELSTNHHERERENIKIIDESILDYYEKCCNILFYKDNIDYETQVEFEIGYDEESNRITIPIRDELGNLVGIKGRYFALDKTNDLEYTKYIYLVKTPRNRILYGLHKTYDYIIKERKVFVCESEKGVMQLWSMGYYNSVATSGVSIGREQIEKLIRLGVDIIFAFDKDILVSNEEIDTEKPSLEEIASKFLDCMTIYAIVDTINILNKKESPMDNPKKWIRLVNECIITVKEGTNGD